MAFAVGATPRLDLTVFPAMPRREYHPAESKLEPAIYLDGNTTSSATYGTQVEVRVPAAVHHGAHNTNSAATSDAAVEPYGPPENYLAATVDAPAPEPAATNHGPVSRSGGTACRSEP